MIETLAKARDNGWKITARCASGPREGMKRVRECKESIRLDLDTLIWTRGAAFSVSMLEGRLKCPRYGGWSCCSICRQGRWRSGVESCGEQIGYFLKEKGFLEFIHKIDR